jgi:porphobilinogen synthase
MNYKTFRQFRTDQQTRDKFAEVKLLTDDFIYPYFVIEGENIKNEIDNLWNVYQFSIDLLLNDLEITYSLGINKVLLFGVIDSRLKISDGSAAWADDSIIVKAIHAISLKFPGILIFTDVCLCGYTSHGHCGLVENNEIKNNETLPLLAKMAASHARAGAHFVAPSAMMDGQVSAIKQALQQITGNKTKILSYSAKFASGFYGPFRNAAGSAPSFGDRKSYQMDYRVNRQAIDEIEADIYEGADWVMVKPAHAYLDIISKGKQAFEKIPMVAYHVSGEYMMIKAAAKQGIVDETKAFLETNYAIKRAGANFIISYYAKELARLL